MLGLKGLLLVLLTIAALQHVVAWDRLPSLLTGNKMIWKTSNSSPSSSNNANLLRRVGAIVLSSGLISSFAPLQFPIEIDTITGTIMSMTPAPVSADSTGKVL